MVTYVQHPFLGTTSIEPAPITRKDSQSSESTSFDEDNFSKSEEDIVLNDNAFSTDKVRHMTTIVMMKKMNILLNSYYNPLG